MNGFWYGVLDYWLFRTAHAVQLFMICLWYCNSVLGTPSMSAPHCLYRRNLFPSYLLRSKLSKTISRLFEFVWTHIPNNFPLAVLAFLDQSFKRRSWPDLNIGFKGDSQKKKKKRFIVRDNAEIIKARQKDKNNH